MPRSRCCCVQANLTGKGGVQNTLYDGILNFQSVQRVLTEVWSVIIDTYLCWDEPIRAAYFAAWRLAGPNAHHLAW